MATFTNQATLAYGNQLINSNIVTGEVVEPLSINKESTEETYTRGQTVPFTIGLVNNGTTPLNGLTVTDTLGAYTADTQTVTPLTYDADSLLFYLNGVLQPTPTVASENPLTITGVNIPAGGDAVLVYTATANEFAPLGTTSEIRNTATATGAGLINPVTAEEVITQNPEPELAITKSLSPQTTTPDGQITYTFDITNTGATEVTDAGNASIRDTFNPIIDISSVTFNGVALTSPDDYTYDQTTGEFRTVDGRITVPAATYSQDPTTGEWTTTPGTSTLTVTGTI